MRDHTRHRHAAVIERPKLSGDKYRSRLETAECRHLSENQRTSSDVRAPFLIATADIEAPRSMTAGLDRWERRMRPRPWR